MRGEEEGVNHRHRERVVVAAAVVVEHLLLLGVVGEGVGYLEDYNVHTHTWTQHAEGGEQLKLSLSSSLGSC